MPPYFRLAYRRRGRQRSPYLGADRAPAEEVRRALRGLRASLRERRAPDRLKASAKAGARGRKRALDRELRGRAQDAAAPPRPRPAVAARRSTGVRRPGQLAIGRGCPEDSGKRVAGSATNPRAE